jgi:predicted adenylyl cyclase CyaB
MELFCVQVANSFQIDRHMRYNGETMPANIEIKARVRNFPEFLQRVEALSDSPLEVIPQEDTFFVTPKGRLKLRVLASDRAQLVYYERPDQDGPKRSNYFIFNTKDPENLKTALKLALGIRGVVKKTRYLYMVGQTRVHLDNVEGLGRFMELEVVLRSGQSDEEGRVIAGDLMKKLGIEPTDLIECAYLDLLEKM